MHRAVFFHKEEKGVEHDRDEALRWYLNAAGKGHANAMNHLAGIYKHDRLDSQ